MKRARIEALSERQANAFLEIALGDRLFAFFAVLVGLGLRRGEACGLKWSDIHQTTGKVKIRRQVRREPVDGRVVAVVGDLKTAESVRELDMPEFVAGALRAHRIRQSAERNEAGDRWVEEGWVFTSPTRPGHYLDPSHAYRRVRAIGRSAGIDGLTVHKVRHTYLTVLAARGTHPNTMQAVAGHSDPKIALAIDTHVGDISKKAAAEAADQAFGGGLPRS